VLPIKPVSEAQEPMSVEEASSEQSAAEGKVWSFVFLNHEDVDTAKLSGFLLEGLNY